VEYAAYSLGFLSSVAGTGRLRIISWWTASLIPTASIYMCDLKIGADNDLGGHDIRKLSRRDKIRRSFLLRKRSLLEIIGEPNEFLLAKPRTHEGNSEAANSLCQRLSTAV
jgi:hypothetical protein